MVFAFLALLLDTDSSLTTCDGTVPVVEGRAQRCLWCLWAG